MGLLFKTRSMKLSPLLFGLTLGAFASCGPITDKEEGGELEFEVKLVNDSDVPITVKAVFDLCKIEDGEAVQTAAAKTVFEHRFVADCESDDDYDDNDEKIELKSSTGKHDVSVSSGCREATTCTNEACTTVLDANCKEQPVPRTAPPKS